MNADRIFVLEKGKLVEQGSHQELLALDRLYARLWVKQTSQIEKGYG
jgi:ABC-type multidrug transport system fused ATPase/permease subunit